MIHQYKSNGYNIVLDVNSGSVHVVDELVYDILALYEVVTLVIISHHNINILDICRCYPFESYLTGFLVTCS